MATLTSSLVVQLLDRFSTPARGIGAALARLNGQSARFNRGQMAGAAMARGFGSRLLAMGAGYIGVSQGIRRTVGAAISFEEAFSDVRKVLNASDEQLANIKRQIVDMSRVLPTSTEGLAAIFAAAGQSNVPIEELGKFSEMVAKVAVAWDTSEGATSEALAKIKTQLHLSVGEVGLLADAINYLSNNSAAKAADLVDYEKRIAAMGDMFGFTKEQTLAFGGAMIAAGGETNVAATSFRNMGKALTKGGQATKKQRLAFHQLGLDSVKVAKRMQKDALGTTLDVIERIQKLPEWQRISIASALFGDEARALQPVLANTTELRRQLGLVGDQANYAGSAYQEYLVRADTTANALKIIGNKIKATFMDMGERWLPTIKTAGEGLGHMLDTLGDRVTVFDRVSVSIRGFMRGLAGDASVRETVNAIADLLFGAADGSGAADQLGRLFETFRRGGAAIREFWKANKENPVVKFLGQISGYGFSLFVASTGIALMAGAVAKLARAMLILSGASAAISIIKSLAGFGGALLGGGKVKAPKTPKPPAPPGGSLAAIFGVLGRWSPWIASLLLPGDTPKDRTYTKEQLDRDLDTWTRMKGYDRVGPRNPRGRDSGEVQRERSLNDFLAGPQAQAAPVPDVAAALRDTIVQTKPTGVQQVQVTNPTRPNQTFNISITGVAGDLKAIAGAVVSAIGSMNKDAAEASYSMSDGGL